MKEHPSQQEDYAEKIIDQINNTTKKPDNNVLLSLFKMYDFDEGIINLCRKLGMRDDLLNFYISRNRDEDIIALCKEHGEDEVNLWIHALKYFVKLEDQKEDFIPAILDELSKIPNLSPLPVLNILSKSKNIPYEHIKSFFLQKYIPSDLDSKKTSTISKKIKKSSRKTWEKLRKVEKSSKN